MADPLTLIALAVGALTAYTASIAKKAQKAAERASNAAKGVLANTDGSGNHIPVIYGERRVGGSIVMLSTANASASSLPNNTLYMVMVVGEGEVESITDIEIDGRKVSETPRLAATSEIYVHLGGDNQAVDPMLHAQVVEWTDAHRGRGVAYIAFRFAMSNNDKYNPYVFGQPEITALVKGKKIYDPRSGLTAWSDNAALCLRDYLTSSRYGKGFDAALLPDENWIDAANDCDGGYDNGDGNTGGLYKCNAVIDTSKQIWDNVDEMLPACRGTLPYIQGKYYLFADIARAPIFNITKDHIIGGVKISGDTKENRYNQIRVSFANKDLNYQPDQIIYPAPDSAEYIAMLAEDGGESLVLDWELETATDFYAVRELARIILKRSRLGLRVSLRVQPDAIELIPSSICTLTSDKFTNKHFQVEDAVLYKNGEIGLSLLEYDSSIYPFATDVTQQAYQSTSLPDPTDVAPPTNLQFEQDFRTLQDGTRVPILIISWTPADDAFVTRYDVNYRLDPNDDFLTVTSLTNRIELRNILSTDTLEVEIYASSGFVRSSTALTGSIVPSGDTEAPAAPLGFTLTGGYKQFELSWSQSTASDFDRARVYRSDDTDFNNAVIIAEISATNYIDAGYAGIITRTYWVDFVDRSKNASPISAALTASTKLLHIDDFDAGVVKYEFLSPEVTNDLALERRNAQQLAETVLGDALDRYKKVRENKTALAVARQTLKQEISDAGEVVAQLDLELTAALFSNAAQLLLTQQALVTETGVRAQQVLLLQGDVDDNHADFLQEKIVTVDRDDAISQLITLLTATVGQNTGQITSNATVSANADTVIISLIDALTAVVGQNTSQINTNATASASASGALADLITVVATATGDNATSISQQLSSINGIKGVHSIVIDNNGHVSGTALISDIVDGNPTSSFIVRADSVAFASVNDASDDYPFVYYTVDTVVNKNGTNYTIPAGLYVKDAMFENASIGSAQLAGIIQSDDFVAGVSGWQINKITGVAEFNDVDARGSITADSIKANSLNIIETINLKGETVGVGEYVEGADHVMAGGAAYAEADIIPEVTVETANGAAIFRYESALNPSNKAYSIKLYINQSVVKTYVNASSFQYGAKNLAGDTDVKITIQTGGTSGNTGTLIDPTLTITALKR